MKSQRASAKVQPSSAGETLMDKLKLYEVIPHFSLPSSSKKEIDLWSYKQRKNLVIFFHHGYKCPFCQKKLEELARVYKEIQGFEGEVLAISFDSLKDTEKYLEKVAVPFPLLSDQREEATEKYTYRDEERDAPFPSIFITDRYEALRYQKIAHEADQLQGVDDVLGWLLLIQSECPECSHL